MRTTVSIDDALLARAKQRAARRGVTLGRVVDDALQEHLASPERPRTRVVLPVAHGGAVRAGIDPTSNRDLYDALDEGSERTS